MGRIFSYFNTSTPTVPGDFLVHSLEGVPPAALSLSWLGLPRSVYHFVHLSELISRFYRLLYVITCMSGASPP